MKKLALLLALALTLGGCANMDWREARSKVGQITNGMTVQQAESILGIPPTDLTDTVVRWRRGNAQSYSASVYGAIEFHLRNGIIVDVPEGGIYGEIAHTQWLADQKVKREKELAELERKQAESEKMEKEEAEAKARQLAQELAGEAKAAVAARFPCDDKLTCSKVFSLAQIYLANSVDQKIQVVTDTIVQTYNPSELTNIGGSITKFPSKGEGAEIVLDLSCKEDGSSLIGSSCRRKKTAAYLGFPLYLKANLK